MDLKDFIKNTITSISEAIVETQNELTEKGVIVNPDKTLNNITGQHFLQNNGRRFVQSLDFDFLLSIDEKQNINGKTALKVASILDIGGGGVKDNQQLNQNRIKFTIPVAFNTTKTPNEYVEKISVR